MRKLTFFFEFHVRFFLASAFTERLLLSFSLLKNFFLTFRLSLKSENILIVFLSYLTVTKKLYKIVHVPVNMVKKCLSLPQINSNMGWITRNNQVFSLFLSAVCWWSSVCSVPWMKGPLICRVIYPWLNSYHAILHSTFLFSFLLFKLFFPLNSLNTLLWSPLYIHPLVFFYLPSLSLLGNLRELLFIFRQLCCCLIYSKISILYEIINQDVSHLTIIDLLGKM